MKIATWNVNGARAREAQLREFIDKEQPDILCLQEIKASIDQLPMWLCEIEGYWCYWHGGKGYSGVGLHVRKDTVPERPAFQHPPFDYEHRVVTAQLPELTVASIYVPNGGKDFDAKLRFLEALTEFAAEHEAATRPLVLCGDMTATVITATVSANAGAGVTASASGTATATNVQGGANALGLIGGVVTVAP